MAVVRVLPDASTHTPRFARRSEAIESALATNGGTNVTRRALVTAVVGVLVRDAIGVTAPNLSASNVTAAATASVALALLPRAAINLRIAVPNARTGAYDGDFFFASSTASTGRTQTSDVVDLVDASTALRARAAGAFVNVDTAVGTREARGAFAEEPIDPVDATSTVETRVGRAIVDVILTLGPLVALSTDARIRVADGDASSAVFTRVRSTTGVIGYLTSLSFVSLLAVTNECFSHVHAGAAMLASGYVAVSVS